MWKSTDPIKKEEAPIMNNKVFLYCIIGPYIIIIMVDWALKTSIMNNKVFCIVLLALI